MMQVSIAVTAGKQIHTLTVMKFSIDTVMERFKQAATGLGAKVLEEEDDFKIPPGEPWCYPQVTFTERYRQRGVKNTVVQLEVLQLWVNAQDSYDFRAFFDDLKKAMQS